MRDEECVAFLQWALPRLAMRWPGFRQPRRQVCRRIQARIDALGLPDPSAYRNYLEDRPGEWEVLDHCCRVTISRFFRDRGVYRALYHVILPRLARQAIATGRHTLRVWSAGCASGEEPYSVALLWHHGLAERFPDLQLHILATDTDPALLDRAARACYPPGCLRELPRQWQATDFDHRQGQYCLHALIQRTVTFCRHDVRETPPGGPFDLVLWRNLVFTYFAPQLQKQCLGQLGEVLVSNGVLVLGKHEALPEDTRGFSRLRAGWPIYCRRPDRHDRRGSTLESTSTAAPIADCHDR